MLETDKAEAPRDFASLRALLLARKDALPKRLAQVAGYAMANPDDIAFGTVASIAEAAGVPTSTLVRFAQALGYQGFSDLQLIFRSRLRDRVLDYDERLRSLAEHARGVSKPALLFAGFSDAAEESVRSVRERIDPHRIEEAVEKLISAETIYLIGQRRSFPVTSYMSYAMGKLGIRNVLVGSAAGTDAETLSFAGPKDAAVAVSFTPYASASVGQAKQLAEQNVPMVVITDSPFSPLASLGAVWFEVVEADYEGFRPLSATLALAMTLVVSVAEARG
jgi:DNA-binding MurR/RpiR family transcriptional regulator